MVGIALAGLVASIIGLTLTRQQRFYRTAAEAGFVRESVRDAMDVLSTDLRQMSVADTVRLLADSAVEFFATIGVSVVCQSAGNQIALPAVRTSGNSLSAFLAQPDTGDIAAFYADSSVDSVRWERHRILGVAARGLSSSCPASSGFSVQSEVDVGSASVLLTLETSATASVKPGAPVRFLRRGRYSLYHASDGDWYLGYRRCNAIGSTCGAIQPISGPYRRYSGDPLASGLVFEYFDSGGRRYDRSSPSFALARVDVTARSESEYAFSVAGGAGHIADSATVIVAIRNRIP
jgi:hypothetical protein